MKEFVVDIGGTFKYSTTVKAENAEEAIDKAMDRLDGVGSIDYEILDIDVYEA